MGNLEHPTITAVLAILIWFGSSVVFCMRHGARRSFVVSCVLGVLFLPVFRYKFIHGIPSIDKDSVIPLGLFFILIFSEARAVLACKPRAVDVPMIVWCLCPFFSSVTNGLGAYDGLNAVVLQTWQWGLPYFMGRLLYSDLAASGRLARTLFWSAILYIPLCLFEARMSPQLHRMLYGYHQHMFNQSFRPGGGYRPLVFMTHGLQVSFWMCIAAVVGVWFFASVRHPNHYRRLMAGASSVLVFTCVVMRSVGALLLLGMGMVSMLNLKILRNRLFLMFLVALPIVYILMRMMHLYSMEQIAKLAGLMFGQVRATSVLFRFTNEEVITARAFEHFWFGWGRWNRANILAIDLGSMMGVFDGLWLVALANTGVVGLASIFTVFLAPAVRFFRYCRRCDWRGGMEAARVGLIHVLVLYAIDCLLNAMVSPFLIMVVGGLTGQSLVWKTRATRWRNEEAVERLDAKLAQHNSQPM